jgi:hypothetical protein
MKQKTQEKRTFEDIVKKRLKKKILEMVLRLANNQFKKKF